MARNPERRAALVDAAIEVLAREGARGLTFRAVDTAAGVPAGTASNYFTSRDDLLAQVTAQIHQRIAPDPDDVAAVMAAPPSRELVTELLRWVNRRVAENRTGYLAMLELRLEATRRPELRAELTRVMREVRDEDLRFHLDSGLPGDRTAVTLMYLAMTGLMLEQLTLPGVVPDEEAEGLISTLVERAIGPEGEK
ncbi:TetR/AcrR family transcriptional regulator [Streptomyces tubercidicus]|uniref:TetR family transcriptional regulator n=1 Tax=Streptomyces tubercidicus TaxID=47759 RepID=A0A640UQU4_9ACTN|nr:TetR/AcrR family transcriptional regulator [Streptomyces tubercidicus]WAU12578.1 TetR family transcriptional regulator [Streptomyces tubercidicus]GFE38037.1 TetR family transcriptional regulator [Streptomyces tubercidicus]